MSIYRIFAANLRERCHALGTIAEACRGAGINRQQFNKYLSGASLPNSRTLKRICAYLQVSEESLFSSAGLTPSAQTASSATGMQWTVPASTIPLDTDGAVEEIVTLIAKSLTRSQQATIKPGNYYCYFPVQNVPGFVVRSLLQIWKSQHSTVFKRLTLFRSPENAAKILAVGRHRGLVVESAQNTYFLGLDARTKQDLSLIVTENQKIATSSVSRGLGIIRGGSSVFCCHVCLEHLSPTQASSRDVIAQLGILSATDPSLSPLISGLFNAPNSHGSNQIEYPQLEQMLGPRTPV
jgi:transcriptional regulator with XRE-family HTH domain